MRTCVFCKRPYKRESKTSFHKFPTDVTERNKWLEEMKAVNWTPKKHDYLCSEHFDSQCFIQHFNRKTLKLGSVPTIFKGVFKAISASPTPERKDAKHGRKLLADIMLQKAISASATPNESVDTNYGIKLLNESNEDTVEKAVSASPIPESEDTKYGIKLLTESSLADTMVEIAVSVCRTSEDSMENEYGITLLSESNEDTMVQKAKSASPTPESMDTNKCGITLLTDINVEDTVIQKDTSTTHALMRDTEDITRTDHNYDVDESRKKSRISYGVAHDHQYESSPKSLQKAAKRTKLSLIHSKAKVKALTQQVNRLKMKVANLKTYF